MKVIRVAFIYGESNIFLTGKHFDNTYYHFFMNALKRNNRIQVTYFPTKQVFDALTLKGKFDIILLWTNYPFGMPEKILNMQKLDIPVIARIGDPKDAKRSKKYHHEWKIDYYFHFFPESYVKELYPSHIKYKNIIYGLEPSLYQNLTPFNRRIKNHILNSGAVANLKLASRLLDKIRNPKFNAMFGYYLRTKCNELPYVDYTSTLQHEYVNDRYPLLLQKYRAAIAASSDAPTIKYWEIPAAGCLTFMEMTDFNRGKEILDFVDGESAIFIDLKNYKARFEEYLADQDNPKWAKIAESGRKIAIEKYNNDKGVDSLIDLMETLL